MNVAIEGERSVILRAADDVAAGRAARRAEKLGDAEIVVQIRPSAGLSDGRGVISTINAAVVPEVNDSI